MCICEYASMCMCVRNHVCLYVCVCMSVRVHVYVCVYMCAHACECMCVYTRADMALKIKAFYADLKIT